MGQKYLLKDQTGKIIKYSSELKNIIAVLSKRNLRLIKWLRKNFYQKKFVLLARKILFGEKNGETTGIMWFIVPKDVLIKNLSS